MDSEIEIPEDVEVEVERRLKGFTDWVNKRFPLITMDDKHSFCVLVLSALDRDGLPVFKPYRPEVQSTREDRIEEAYQAIVDDDAPVTIDTEPKVSQK